MCYFRSARQRVEATNRSRMLVIGNDSVHIRTAEGQGPTLPTNRGPSTKPFIFYFSPMTLKSKVSSYSITDRRVPELIIVLGSQPASDVSHKPGGRMPLLSTRPAVTLLTHKSCYQFRCLVNRGTMGVNSLPKTITRQRRGCDLNAGPTAPESSTLTTRLPSHPLC